MEHHQIALHEQRNFFLRSKEIVCKANEKQHEYAGNKIKQISFDLGEPIYFKNHRGTYKLDKTWKPYYTVIERTGRFTYRIKDQVMGVTTMSHAVDLRSSKVDEGNISDGRNRPMRKVALAAPMIDSDSEEGMIDAPPKIIDRFLKMRENPLEECLY